MAYLLPSSAAAFAPRAAPSVALDTKPASWLTKTLRRVKVVKRPLPYNHTQHLKEVLSSENAIWTLCSMMFPKAPEAELLKDENPLVEALFNHQMINIEAYVVHVDMVSQHGVGFKLTQETIESLVEIHGDVYCADAAASTSEWPGKQAQLQNLKKEFIQDVNKFVFRTDVKALEGLDEDGSGEMLCDQADNAKSAIKELFVPLRPSQTLNHLSLLRASTTAHTHQQSTEWLSYYWGLNLLTDVTSPSPMLYL